MFAQLLTGGSAWVQPAIDWRALAPEVIVTVRGVGYLVPKDLR